MAGKALSDAKHTACSEQNLLLNYVPIKLTTGRQPNVTDWYHEYSLHVLFKIYSYKLFSGYDKIICSVFIQVEDSLSQSLDILWLSGLFLFVASTLE